MRVFVPVEDAPKGVSVEMLVPYRCGVSCEHGLRETTAYFQSSRGAQSLQSPELRRTSFDGGEPGEG